MARDGCREARSLTMDMARSAISGRCATTTSVSTLVRMRTRTSRASSGVARPWASALSVALAGAVCDSRAAPLQISASWWTVSLMLVERACQRVVVVSRVAGWSAVGTLKAAASAGRPAR